MTAKKKTATRKRVTAKTTTASRSSAKAVPRAASKRARKAVLKDPAGGLTAAGRRAFNAKDGSNLKPGVRGPADTPEKMRRKGSFLRRHFTTLSGPLLDEDGKPTRLALSAHAWGEPVPKTAAAAKKLADKGARLLERFQRAKKKTAA